MSLLATVGKCLREHQWPATVWNAFYRCTSLEPPLDLFVWRKEMISTLPKPALHVLVPPPSAPIPPAGCGVYPKAPVYTLNLEPDHSYRRGYRYAAPFYTANKLVERENMLNIQMPPNVTPVRFDLHTQTFRSDPIAGMVKLPLGVPMVHLVDNDPKRAVTAVCGHSLDTLMQYEEGPKVRELVPRLMKLTWGTAATETDPGVPGIFEFPGMRRNLRSKNIDVEKLVPGDGSYNLASTHGEGEGSGVFMPAVQMNTPQATAVIKEVLEILHQLYRLIMPLCISRFEWEMIEFNSLENNVIAFGGLDPGPTSVQCNASTAANVVDIDLNPVGVSETLQPGDSRSILRDIPPASKQPEHPPVVTSGIHTSAEANDPPLPQFGPELPPEEVDLGAIFLNLLENSIGPQGSIHGDFKDDPIAFTLFVLLFRLPPGSDLGPFLWMRGAIYLRETDEYILFTSFKGRDLHTGTAPTYVKKIQEAWITMDTAKELFKRFGRQGRCGYVLYPSMAGTSHNTQIAYSPSLGFLHSPAANERDETRRFYSLHGDTIMGNPYSRANRFGIEGVYALKNFFMQCNLTLGLGVNTLLKHITYVDEYGNNQTLDPSLLDIEDPELYERMSLYRRYYFWWSEVIAEQYSLGLTKPQFKDRQQEIRDNIAGRVVHQKSLPTQHKLLPKPICQEFEPGSIPVIERIVSRRQQGSDAIYRLILEGSSDEQEYSEEKTKWIRQGPNAAKCLEYLAKHGSGPPSAITDISAAPMLVDSVVGHVNDATISEDTSLPTISEDISLPNNPSQETSVDDSQSTALLANGSEMISTLDSSSHTAQHEKSKSPLAANVTEPVASPTLPSDNLSLDNAPNLSQHLITPTQSSANNLLHAPEADVPGPLNSENRDSMSIDLPANSQLSEPTESRPDEADPEDSDWDFVPVRNNKRKRKAVVLSGTESDESRPSLGHNRNVKQRAAASDSSDYEVEAIKKWRFNDDQDGEYLVSWTGYDSSEDMWLDESELSSSRQAVEEFNASNNLPKAQFSDSSDDEFLLEKPPSTVQKASKNSSSRAQQRLNRMLDLNLPSCRPVQMDDLNEKFLWDLLKPTLLLKHTQMYFELPLASSSWGSRLAKLTLECISDVGASVPDMIPQMDIYDLVQRGLQAQICRSLVAFYQWIVNLGPSLAEQLALIHKLEGEATLAEKFPELAPMVNHVVAFVQEHWTEQRELAEAKAKQKSERLAAEKAARAAEALRIRQEGGKSRPRGRPSKRKIGCRAAKTPADEAISVEGESQMLPTEEPIASSSNLEQTEEATASSSNIEPVETPARKISVWAEMPGDLFGFLPSTKKPIRLERLGAKVVIRSRDHLYDIAARYLCRIWEEQLILKPMTKIDQYLNPGERPSVTKAFMEGVRNRCITRGAVLQCVADIFGDGLFASTQMKQFLHRPCRLFPSGLDRDEHFAHAIEKSDSNALQVLDAWFAAELVANPEVGELSSRLGNIVHRGLLSLKVGAVLTDEEFDNPHEQHDTAESFSRLATRAAGAGTKKRARNSLEIRPTLQSLLPKTPTFGIAAVIVREALSQFRKKPATDRTEVYRRMLTGRHPTTDVPTRRDPDQMNPIRADLQGFRLLQLVLPPRLWTTKTGLSSLLAFMSTGQGTMTKGFLESKKDKMHFQSLQDCVSLFDSMETRNHTLDPAKQVKYFNPAIYGQANLWYSTHPRARVARNTYVELTLAEKFGPFFKEELQRSWSAFLGPLADQDPASSDAPRKSWEEVLRWILRSNLKGFGSGLAPLQFANNMVLAGIAESPSPAVMAQWIFANKSFGAFAGLRALGFRLTEKASPAVVRAAFFCFYYWLDHHLSIQDKIDLHFNTIFVEQLLCKIGRWKYRMLAMANIKLVEVGEELLKSEDWEQGANIADHTRFPFPSLAGLSLSVFRRIIEEELEELDIDVEMPPVA
ncbi:hypothetical protein C8R43DRAFT_1169236 [Mycena crocata]|nr:hypothetical protein C8R43DRAFT_1169236 [Mycena crocata]